MVQDRKQADVPKAGDGEGEDAARSRTGPLSIFGWITVAILFALVANQIWVGVTGGWLNLRWSLLGVVPLLIGAVMMWLAAEDSLRRIRRWRRGVTVPLPRQLRLASLLALAIGSLPLLALGILLNFAWLLLKLA
ncbi:hypothetical protein C3489_07800 [Streptomyces sp. Ru71]|uniref:hypothetical protein n=1 Tax=Streptomyces sp. Ru71 TaxID=2080746 RepID=UPI000CDD3D37|nr:hypothetical protein [Streptomyces sp. Ru71]POX55783.1 hypothetical protein C3489_07800 [Streptomyces sp. Ru71]